VRWWRAIAARKTLATLLALAALLVVAILLSLKCEGIKESDQGSYDSGDCPDSSSPYSEQDLAKFEPPNGSAYTGVVADQEQEDTVEVAKQKWNDWTRLMDGTPPYISHTFEGFNAWFDDDFDVAKARGAMPLITWQLGEAGSPDTIANAGRTPKGKPTDEIILRNAKFSADYAEPVFLRVGQEMNAHWFSWGAYNEDGSRRSFSAKDFQNMWRRIVVIFRGGKVSVINQRLASLGLPPLDPDVSFPDWMELPPTSEPDSYFKPAENVAFVFNPVDAPGIPDVEGNRWLDYYPGDSYVDWVGQTTYDTTGDSPVEQKFEWLETFYQEFSVRRGKPYMMGEWGVVPKDQGGSGDDPAYINRILDWQGTHPKVKALVYFSVNQGNRGDFRLSNYPESAKALAAGVSQPRFLNSK
jgi:hypothetical protein